MHWSAEQVVVAVILLGLGYIFLLTMFSLLGHRLRTQIRRHDIIAGARRRRNEYLRAIAQRAARVSSFDVVAGDGDGTGFNVDIVEPKPERQAA